MLVSELIKKLSVLDQDKEICLQIQDPSDWISKIDFPEGEITKDVPWDDGGESCLESVEGPEDSDWDNDIDDWKDSCKVYVIDLGIV